MLRARVRGAHRECTASQLQVAHGFCALAARSARALAVRNDVTDSASNMLRFSASRVLARTATSQLPVARRAVARAARGSGGHYLLPSEQATEDLASIMASVAVLGDSYLLDGALGAGKSAFRCGFTRVQRAPSAGRQARSAVVLTFVTVCTARRVALRHISKACHALTLRSTVEANLAEAVC